MEEEQDYLLLIMNCVKYRHKAEEQKRTWLYNSNIPYYHVLGDPDMLIDHVFDEEERILWVKVRDDYNSLPKKVMAAYAAIRKTFQHLKYVFKTDDDQMLQSSMAFKFFNKIATTLEAKNPKVHYGGQVIDVDKPYLSQYHRIHPELPPNLEIHSTKYCSGRFYFLSMDAICDLLTKREQINNEFLEDYAIGLNLHERYKMTILHMNTSIFFKDQSL